jgi:hypothetical protein
MDRYVWAITQLRTFEHDEILLARDFPLVDARNEIINGYYDRYCNKLKEGQDKNLMVRTTLQLWLAPGDR